MKILLVAPFSSPQRDEAIARGFRECGAEVTDCSYGDLLYSNRLLTRIQLRISAGPVCFQLARRVRRAAEGFSPDVILFRRPLEFTPAMLRYVRQHSRAVLASFNNDDPFSLAYRDRRWRQLRAAIPLFDVHFAFRRRNLDQYRQHGARVVALWEPFYSPWLHRPLIDHQEDDCAELLFAMHAERDGRRESLLALLRSGVRAQVHCWNWDREFGEEDAKVIGVRPPIWGDDYVRAIGRAAGTLCFFSKQNGDELTSRVFEIPACGGLLIAQRNERIQALFRDGEEALLFSNDRELVELARTLVNDPVRVRNIKRRGRERLLSAGHSVVDRCAAALEVLQQVKAQNAEIPIAQLTEREGSTDYCRAELN